MTIGLGGGDPPLVPDPPATPFRCEVIDLDGVRIQWGRPDTKLRSSCEHRSLVYSETERRVWCEDCERTIENFDAFMTCVRAFEPMVRAARRMFKQAEEAMAAAVRRRATKALDRAWSSRDMVPCCPHCRKALLPEDFTEHGLTMAGREIEERRRGIVSDKMADINQEPA